jgi:hypothetical protein
MTPEQWVLSVALIIAALCLALGTDDGDAL